MDIEQKILRQIEEKIATHQLVLPSMPDIFVKIRTIVDDPKSNLSQISKIITRDPSLTARILKVSNNALYRRDREISSLQNAVSRMGLKLIKTLVTSHTITQMFNQPSGLLKPFFTRLQKHSTVVSAHAFAIAKNYSQINPEDALLAGLVHNIGYLPMAKCLDTIPEIANQPDLLIEIMGKLHNQVGEMVLKSWSFPLNIIKSSVDYVNQFRKGSATIDLTDIVIIAGLNTYRGTDHICTLPDWSQYPAFQKIGINTREELIKLDEIIPDINDALKMLGI